MFTTSNYYGGTCVICKQYVAPREGLSASTHGRRWSTRHVSCTPEASKDDRYKTRAENFYRVLKDHIPHIEEDSDGSLVTQAGGSIKVISKEGEFCIEYWTPFGVLMTFHDELEWSLWLSKAGYTEDTL